MARSSASGPGTGTAERPTAAPGADVATTTDAPRSLEELGVTLTAATVAGAEAAAPAIQPPGMAAPAAIAAAQAAITGTWQVDKRVAALWCNQSPRNCWAFIAGLGWRKMSPTSDSSVISMIAIASHARESNARVDYVEESDGTISQIVIW